MVVEHIGRIDTIQRYFVTDNLKINKFFVVTTLHAHSDLGAFFSTQVLLYIFVVDLFTHGFLAVNLDELVASHDAHLLGRAACRGTDDSDGVADELEGHADAFETAYKWFVGFLHILFRYVGGVGVEFLQCSNNGIFCYFVYIGGVDIKILNEIKCRSQFLGIHLPLGLGLLWLVLGRCCQGKGKEAGRG